MQYTEQELAKLIQDVEKEFRSDLAKSEDGFKADSVAADTGAAQPETPLAKAEEEKKDEKPAEDSKESKAPEAKEESKEDKAPEAPKAEEKAPESKDAPAEKPAAPAEAAAAPQAEGQPAPNAAYDAEDMQHLEKMYMSMSNDEQHIHHDVLRKCMDASGMQKCGDMSMNKAEATAPTSIEVKAEDIKTNPEVEILKSEVEAHKAKSEELKKNLDAVQEFLTKLVKKVPQGKAITAYEQVAKSESAEDEKQLTKTEVKELLSKKAADPTLTKSDRDAINAFYLNDAHINTISHLLKN